MSKTNSYRAHVALAGIAAASAFALLLTGCGSNSLAQSSAPVSTVTPTAVLTTDPELNAMLPASIKSAGTINIGVDATYKPNEYMDGTTVVGWDVDLFDAVATKLGVKTNWMPSKFATILNGITAGKYDVGVSSFTVTAEREQSVTMISYANVGVQWATLAGNPKGVDKANPCGKTIAVETGTVEADEVNGDNKGKCKSNQINVLSYDGQDQVNNALMIGKADAMLADYPIAAFAIQNSGGKMVALGDQYAASPYGFVVTKANAGLAQAIAKALTELKADGTYNAILTKWGIQSAALDEFQVNPKV